MRFALLSVLVSIHALLAECDYAPLNPYYCLECFNPRTPCGVRPLATWARPSNLSFQSTHSLRSATNDEGYRVYMFEVSIHALLAECDYHRIGLERSIQRFNPRTPCGVRLPESSVATYSGVFQSTHSLRSATIGPGQGPLYAAVSIHALLAECDLSPCNIPQKRDKFQSTHSLRSATVKQAGRIDTFVVSIHALLAECDCA